MFIKTNILLNYERKELDMVKIKPGENDSTCKRGKETE